MSRVLTTAQKNARSISFGSEQGERPHSLTREVADLRDDIELAINKIEGGDGFPRLIALPAIGGGAGAAPLSLADTAIIHGKNLLAGRAQASATVGSIVFTAILPGTSGNDISVVLADPAGNNQALGAAFAANTLTISLATDGAGAITSTLNDIVAKVNGEGGHAYKVRAALAAGANGADVATAVASTALTGGSGQGVSLVSHVVVNNAIATLDLSNLIAQFTDTEIHMPNTNGAATPINAGNVDTASVCSIELASHTALTSISFTAP